MVRSAPEQNDRPSTAMRRRAREAEIIAATRQLFDERRTGEAQIEDIARAAGVNRAIIYRHFTGKDELFALVMVSYLEELAGEFAEATRRKRTPMAKLQVVIETFVDFGIGYPAFVDCAQAIMRRTGPELLEEVSENAMFKLGRAITACLSYAVSALDEGQRDGTFGEFDSAVLANHMYATGIGALQLARLGMLVREAAPGIPTIARLSTDQVKTFLVATAEALATKA